MKGILSGPNLRVGTPAYGFKNYKMALEYLRKEFMISLNDEIN